MGDVPDLGALRRRGSWHVFPEGFSAHWVRTRVNRACVATAQLTYE